MSQHERNSQPPTPDRRLMVRFPAKASTLVIRDRDVMRAGTEAKLKDVSPTGLGLNLDAELTVGEIVKVRLSNHVQRFEKETRGTVRHVTQLDDGTFYVGIELSFRLTPLDVSLLKMGMPHPTDPSEPQWL